MEEKKKRAQLYNCNNSARAVLDILDRLWRFNLHDSNDRRGTETGLNGTEIVFAKGVVRRRWSSLKNDSHSMFPLEVKPLLVGQGLRSWQAGSSYWLARKTTIKGDEYFMGYTGTIGRRVWAIVKALSGWNARQTSLSPFDSGFLVVVKRTRGPWLHYFIIFKHVAFSSTRTPCFLSSFFTRPNWAWR